MKMVKAASSYIPFKMFTVIVYAISFLCISLWLLALPLIYAYQFILCAIAWSVMPKQGKDVIAIGDENIDFIPWTTEIAPLIEKRAWFLSYQERERWPWWSLAVRLFCAFGPAPMPASFIPRYLPTVIVVKRFRLPVRFCFGPLTRDKEVKLKNLRSFLDDGA